MSGDAVPRAELDEPCIECGRPIAFHCQSCRECYPFFGGAAAHARSAGAAPIDVDVLRDAMVIADRAIGVPVDEQIDHYTAMAIEVAAEYARLTVAIDKVIRATAPEPS